MFTGIIEEIAEVVEIKQDKDNKHFVFKAKFNFACDFILEKGI